MLQLLPFDCCVLPFFIPDDWWFVLTPTFTNAHRLPPHQLLLVGPGRHWQAGAHSQRLFSRRHWTGLAHGHG